MPCSTCRFRSGPDTQSVLVPWRRAEYLKPTLTCDPLSRRSRCACPVHSPDDDGRTLSRSYLPSISSGAAVAATPAWEYRESNPIAEAVGLRPTERPSFTTPIGHLF